MATELSKPYLAQWKDGRITFFLAGTPQDAFNTLDTVGDPVHCTIKQYIGPLCLTFKPTTKVTTSKFSKFELPARPYPQQDLLTDLGSLLEEETFADVELEVDGQSIKCHKAILSQRCSYFRAMFESEMQESRGSTISVKNFGLEVVKAVITFLYTSEIHLPGKEAECDEADLNKSLNPDVLEAQLEYLYELHQAADFYLLENLKQLCEWEILDVLSQNKLDQETAVTWLKKAAESRLEILYKGLLPVIYNCQRYSQCDIMSQLSKKMQEDVNCYAENVLRSEPLHTGKNKELDYYFKASFPSMDQNHIETLVSEGACLDTTCAMHWVCKRWHSSSTCTSDERKNTNTHTCHVLEWMLDQGCSVDKEDHLGNTALHYAVMCMAVPLVSLLLERGSNPEIINKLGLSVWDVHHWTYQMTEFMKYTNSDSFEYDHLMNCNEIIRQSLHYIPTYDEESMEPAGFCYPSASEPSGEFLETVQAYLDKDGHVTGEKAPKIEFEWDKTAGFDINIFEENLEHMAYPKFKHTIEAEEDSSHGELADSAEANNAETHFQRVKEALEDDIHKMEACLPRSRFNIYKFTSRDTLKLFQINQVGCL